MSHGETSSSSKPTANISPSGYGAGYGKKKLSPNEISIVYVSRGPNGATIQPLRLDEEGDFMDDFPGGFFPERLRELR